MANAKAIYGVARITCPFIFNSRKNKHYVRIEIVEDWSDSPISLYKAKEMMPIYLLEFVVLISKQSEEQYKKLKEVK